MSKKDVYETSRESRVIGFLAVFLIGCYLGLPEDKKSITMIIVFAVVVTLVSSFGKSLAKNHQKQIQQERDKFPIKEIDFLRDYFKKTSVIPERDFRLFLRPFLTIKSIQVNNPGYPHSFFGQLLTREEGEVQPKYLNFEFLLARLLEVSSDGKIYAMGGDKEEPSPGRLFVPDDDWKHDFELLAKAAYSVLIIPGYTQSTLWELAWLKSNFMLDKTILIMPGGLNKSQSFDLQDYWQKTSAALEEIGIETPDYNPNGLLFKVNAWGMIDRVEGLNIASPAIFSSNLLKLEEPY